ncbi:MAG: hypothetical protein WC781_02975 [Candidatus Pacearchaeota archaeon]|jgi:hypothetical protein
MANKNTLFLVFGLMIILLSFSIVSAETYKLLCLDKGQTVYFSRCNNAMQDKVCTSDTGCQYCVSVTNSNTYCPANVNICNTQGYSCTSDSSVPEVKNTTTPGVSLNLTQITVSPSLPLSNNGSQKDITISFKSNVYPFIATIKIYETTGQLISSSSPKTISKLSESQITYTIPSGLSDGNHLITLTGTTSQQSTKTINLGMIVVKKPSSSTSTNNQSTSSSTSSSTTATPSTSSTSSTSSQSINPTSSNHNLTDNSDNGISASNTNSNPYSDSSNNSNTLEKIDEINKSSSVKNVTSKITGAAIGTITTGKLTILLIIILVIAIAYSIVKKRRNSNPINEFTI